MIDLENLISGKESAARCVARAPRLPEGAAPAGVWGFTALRVRLPDRGGAGAAARKFEPNRPTASRQPGAHAKGQPADHHALSLVRHSWLQHHGAR